METFCIIFPFTGEQLKSAKKIYYYANRQECDFVIREGGKFVDTIQVAVSVKDDDTRQREIKGLTNIGIIRTTSRLTGRFAYISSRSEYSF